MLPLRNTKVWYDVASLLAFGALLLALGGAPASLAQPSFCGPDSEEIPLPSDTLLYVENQGLTRIFVNLNERVFKLAADPEEVQQSQNAFPMPRFGEITLDVAALIDPQGPNCIDYSTQGPPGTGAETVLAPVLLAGQEVAYAVEDLTSLPESLDLLYNYPNPFRERTTIVYEIPENRRTGLPVQLTIYDTLGRRVQTLVDDVRFPGRFTAVWMGTDARGQRLASGVYFCHLRAGAFQQTIQLVLR
jgi:hypothetical protein